MPSFKLTLTVIVACTLVSPMAQGQSIRADHTTVDPSPIPQSALDAARGLSMNFSHASVGGNLWSGLVLLRSDDSARYAFPQWTDNARGNPGWQAKVDDFATWVGDNENDYEVFLNKFCWIDQDASFTYYRDSMVQLAQTYGDKTLVWFTMPLSSDGSEATRYAFNQSVRTYTAEHNLPLFDIADIESHAANGTLATSGGYETIYAAYTSDNGHLDNDAAQRRVAGAVWYLMARLAGWSDTYDVTCGSATCGETGTAADTESTKGGCNASAMGASSIGLWLAAAALVIVSARRRANLRRIGV